MKRISVLFVMVLLASTFALAQKNNGGRDARPKQRTQPVNLQAEGQQIRDLRKQWDKLFEARDADGQASMFAVDGIFIAGGKEPQEGREAFRQSLLGVLRRPNILLTHEPAKTEVSSSGDMAYELGSWKETWDQPDGHTTLTGRYFAVWKKVDGKWKVVAQTLRVYACSGSSYCK